jgi:HEAT repeat protein
MSHRVRAVQTLGTLGLPRYIPEVREAIGDPSPFVAATAARLLAQEVGAEAAPELCASLERLKTFRTWYLVDMMVGMGQKAVPAIRDALENPELPPRTRAVAAHSLSVLMDLGAADLAANLVVKEEDPELLTALLRLLAQVGTAAHKPSARAHLDSPKFFVRAAATRTLAELGSEVDLPLMIERLTDSSSWVKMAAARGVYRLGGKETLAAMAGKDDPSALYFKQVLAEEAGR